MVNLLKCDMLKLNKSWTFKVLMAVMAGFGVMMAIFYITMESTYVKLYGNVDKLTGWNNALATFSDSSLIIIIGSIMISLFICGDFENRTIQECIMGGYGHGSIILSKTLICLSSIAVIFLPYPLLLSICSSTHYGFGVEINTEFILKLVLFLIGEFFAYGSLMMLCVMIAFITRKTGVSLGVSIAGLIFGGQIFGMVGRVSKVFENIYLSTPLGLYAKFTVMEKYGFNYIIALIESIAWICLLIFITTRFFYRNELK